MTNDSRFLRRVKVKNYKSIAACDVEPGKLTMLVGPNGSGKSNFLDALRFVADALRTTLDHALRDRGGVNEVRRRSSGRPNHFGMRLEFSLPNGAHGHYAFLIAAKPRAGFEVQREECYIRDVMSANFLVESGKMRGSKPRAVAPDRLHLVFASNEPEFRPLYDALSHMAFYNLNPDKMRELQTPGPGDILARDGGNATSVLRVLADAKPELRARIEQFLAAVVPGVDKVEVKSLGPKESLEFQQRVSGSAPWRFFASNMSDGTLRALGILLALFQAGNGSGITVVGIEEPEAALHPAAAGILLDALREASGRSQVIVTSHSPDLMDSVDMDREVILAVRKNDGDTVIAPVDEPSLKVLRDGLYQPGELLRLGQLAPDVRLFEKVTNQLELFG